MNSPSTQIHQRTWIYWVLVSGGARLLTSLLMQVGAPNLFFLIEPIGQWLVLRRHFKKSYHWVWLTMAGGFLGVFFTPTIFPIDARSPLTRFFLFAWFGVFIGVFQWFYLRGRSAKAGWWIVAAALDSGIEDSFANILGSVLGGTITATALIFLLKNQVTDQVESRAEPAPSPARQSDSADADIQENHQSRE